MSTMIPPSEWLKQIPLSALDHDHVPLIGYPPPFPWEQLSSKLSEQFGLPEMAFQPAATWEQRTPENLTKGLGDQIVCLQFALAQTGGIIACVMPHADLTSFLSLFFQQESPDIPQEIEEGFLRFVAVEISTILPQLEFDKTLSLKMMEDRQLPQTSCLSLDVSISIADKILTMRLLLTPEWQQQWKERFAHRSLGIPLSYKLDIPIHLEIGHVSFTPAEWSQVHEGDFLFLDQCSLKSTGEGRLLLTVNHIPVFRGKFKEGKIKILEYPLYKEVTQPMNPPEEEQPIEEAFEETPHEEEHPQEPTQKSIPVTPDQIPINIVVEVGRLQMSIQKLMELQPGNLLDLNVHPENGVDLVVNGKCIAKGELLKIGDTLGVRVLDIG